MPKWCKSSATKKSVSKPQKPGKAGERFPPQSLFVYNFLGHVNLFHGRVEGDKIYIGSMVMDLPKEAQRDAETATVYVRPHLLEIDGQPNHHNHFRATVTHIHAAGPQVKVEPATEWGDLVHVEISQKRYRALRLQREVQVFVTPKEKKVFMAMETA
jgi:sulfate transport system ATP-binding protein